MTELFAFTRQASQNAVGYCFCGDDDNNDNRENTLRLGCRCIVHYGCLITYIYSKLNDRLTMSLNGISCPYGSDCAHSKEASDSAVIYYITLDDLDNIVDYGINHPDLKKYLEEYSCKELTHDAVDQLRLWITEQKENPVVLTDDDFTLFLKSTTKQCPRCRYRSTHYHGHSCHHISPASPDRRGGCPNCHTDYCYKCLSTKDENLRDRNKENKCKCGNWSNFCESIESVDDINKYIELNDGGIPFDKRCGCVICSDCQYQKPCGFCSGNCIVCEGYVSPSPSEARQEWVAVGLALRDTLVNENVQKIWSYCTEGNDELLSEILKAGSCTSEDINKQNKDGDTAIHIACSNLNTKCIAVLTAHPDVSVNCKNYDGISPLLLALAEAEAEAKDAYDIVALLVNHEDIDLFAEDNNGNTPLFLSCLVGFVDIVQKILKAPGTNVKEVINKANTEGMTSF